VTPQLPRLHAVTNDKVLALPDFHERAARITSAPRTAVHLRSGSLGGRQLAELTESTLRSCATDHVFVNDRADVARIVGAGGVHLPAAGLSVASARSIVGSECWIGRSAHNSEEVARAADEGADYVFLGPIWATASHPDREPLDHSALSRAHDIPVIAIGGVTPERVPECLAFGAYGVAVISALWYARDVASAARALSLSFPP
jgi:thiamine-phosphate diphosphorylase